MAVVILGGELSGVALNFLASPLGPQGGVLWPLMSNAWATLASACGLPDLPTDNQELRDQLLQMARNWMAEAMHERYKDAVARKPASPKQSRNRILTPSSAIDTTTQGA